MMESELSMKVLELNEHELKNILVKLRIHSQDSYDLFAELVEDQS